MYSGPTPRPTTILCAWAYGVTRKQKPSNARTFKYRIFGPLLRSMNSIPNYNFYECTGAAKR